MDNEVIEIKGVWTKEECKKVKNFFSSEKGKKAIKTAIKKSKEQEIIFDNMRIFI